MIEMANESGRTAKGNVVFIDRDRNRMHDLNRNIRLIETEISSLRILNPFMVLFAG